MWEFLKNNRLFHPYGIFTLLSSIGSCGVNLFVIIQTAARIYPDRVALIFEEERITYRELKDRIVRVASFLKERFEIRKNQKIAFVCRNHSPYIYSLFASARLGAGIYFLNPDMGKEAFVSLLKRRTFDLLIYDEEWTDAIVKSGYRDKSLSTQTGIFFAFDKENYRISTSIKRSNSGKIVVLTSGSTGNSKAIPRKTSATAFISLFIYLLKQLGLSRYNSLYLATPVYHGFGLAALFVALVLGKKVFMQKRFDAKEICHRIQEEQVEVITLVPSMLQRMLKENRNQLDSLQCIVSGGAMLPQAVIEEAQRQLSGNKIFNLYGSSEAGFCIMATPTDLDYSSKTIGKPVKGVQVKIINPQGEEVENGTTGEICIRCKWSVRSDEWIPTGDLGYADMNGYYYLMGRTDDMIVSGGENVYPYELEQLLLKHPQITSAAVIGVADREFGQRLKAFIIPSDKSLTVQDIKDWLYTRCARYQMPKDMVFMNEFPLTGSGKIDKRAL